MADLYLQEAEDLKEGKNDEKLPEVETKVEESKIANEPEVKKVKK